MLSKLKAVIIQTKKTRWGEIAAKILALYVQKQENMSQIASERGKNNLESKITSFFFSLGATILERFF